MIRKPLLLKIYDAANMQRWNDKICPVELRELDKQAHKMIIAYVLGKFEEDHGFNWGSLIEGGIFEFLHRLVLTDLKPQIFYKIKEDRAKYKQLNRWVCQQLEPVLSPLGAEFAENSGTTSGIGRERKQADPECSPLLCNEMGVRHHREGQSRRL